MGALNDFILLGAILLFMAMCYLQYEDYKSEGKLEMAILWGAMALICALIIAVGTIIKIEMLR